MYFCTVDSKAIDTCANQGCLELKDTVCSLFLSYLVFVSITGLFNISKAIYLVSQMSNLFFKIILLLEHTVTEFTYIVKEKSCKL